MAHIALPEQALLLQLFRYDPNTGIIYRKTDGGSESPAGTVRPDGYMHVAIDGTLYMVHRIILKMVTGFDPAFVDHEDGVRNNNRRNNISSVTKKQNHKNIRRPANNSSGVIGVSFEKRRGVWYAYIKSDGVMTNLGCYKNIEEAVAVRRRAEVERGFHSNHGREPLILYKSASQFKRERAARGDR